MRSSRKLINLGGTLIDKYLKPLAHQIVHKIIFFWHKNNEHQIVVHLSLTGEIIKVHCLCNIDFYTKEKRDESR